jgi:DNA (cytosine-5)-methyltransferase 1
MENNKKQITGVSLFAGIGGFDLALEKNGVKVVASVEWDKHAQSVLKNRFPNSQLFGNIQEVTGEQLINAGFNPENGIITGGFPCQDLSVAGKRAGLGGNRSGLFWEICRLLDETKTKHFILENVPGLLSSNNGADMGTVITALAQRGYGLAYRVLDAQHFGVPQRRRRVFIVGSLGNNGGTPAEILAIAEGRTGYLAQSGKSSKSSANSPTKSLGTNSEIVGTLQARDYKGVGNQYVEENKLVIFDPHQTYGVRIQTDTVNTLTAAMGTGGNNVPMIAYPIQDGRDLEKEQNGIGYGEEQAPAYTLDTTGAQAVAYSMHGAMIGRCVKAGPSGSGFLGENEPAYTLTASSQARHGVAFLMRMREGKEGGGKGPLLSEEKSLTLATANDQTLFDKGMVRRLTPLECERLQGFPDGWTEGQTDGHRYKQLGNAVAVPVVSWIIQRLVKTILEGVENDLD